MIFARAAQTAVIASLLALAACGSDADPAAENGTGSPEPTTTPEADDFTATETLFAIGAGDQVVAVDDQSDFPAEAPVTGLSGFEPNVEAIAEYRPDLVLASGDGPSDLTDGLERLGVSVIIQPAAADLDDAYQQIEDVGAATGHGDEATALVADMQDRIANVLADWPDGPQLSVFHELGPDLYTASSDTFIGQIYAELGLANVADEAAEQAGTPYPQVSTEFLLSADPDLLILADNQCCGVTPDQVAERPGWDALTAVRNGTVVVIDEDIASRWGPRVPDFVEAVADAIGTAQGTG